MNHLTPLTPKKMKVSLIKTSEKKFEKWKKKKKPTASQERAKEIFAAQKLRAEVKIQ